MADALFCTPAPTIAIDMDFAAIYTAQGSTTTTVNIGTAWKYVIVIAYSSTGMIPGGAFLIYGSTAYLYYIMAPDGVYSPHSTIVLLNTGRISINNTAGGTTYYNVFCYE